MRKKLLSPSGAENASFGGGLAVSGDVALITAAFGGYGGSAFFFERGLGGNDVWGLLTEIKDSDYLNLPGALDHASFPSTALLSGADSGGPPEVSVFDRGSDAVRYCTPGTSASGCQAFLTACGTPSASVPSGFVLTANQVEGTANGLFFFGSNGRQAAPWGNGSSFQCVAPPVKRGGVVKGAGTQGLCDGLSSQDLNALWCATCPKPGKFPGAGSVVQAQFWYRDVQSTSNQVTSLSDAVELAIAP